MKLLFVLDSVDNPTAANAILARRVGALLAQKGHNVHFLELYDGKNTPPTVAQCTNHLLPFADEAQMNKTLEFGRKDGSPVAFRLAKLCAQPAAFGAAVRQLVLKRPRRHTATKAQIEQLCAVHSFDAVVAVSAPYATSFALASAEISAQKASWQMDPYAANQTYSAPGGWQAERALDDAMHAIFVAPTAAPDFGAGAPLASVAHKMQVLDFPALVPLPAQETPQNKRIRCVFVGSLYQTIRTPHFALELFAALNAPDVELVFVGGGWEQFPADLLLPYQAVLGERLVATGAVPKAEADQQLLCADVLINLGNGIDNQVPSKLFEYFALGKPILHLAKLANDPALAYLSQWPLACCLQESEGVTETSVAALRHFLQNSGHKTLPYSAAKALFAANTPAFAAHTIENALQT